MAITIETINIKDTIGKLRTKVNDNFTSVKDTVDDIETMVDVSNSNVITKNATIQKGARATSVEIFTVEASGRVKGNFNVVGDLTTNDVTVSNGKQVNINSGNLNVKGESSKVDIEGDITMKRNIIKKDFADSSVDASNTGTYLTVTSNVGVLDINDKHAMILDFSSYSSSANISNTNTVKDIQLKQGKYQGQEMTLVVNSNSSSGKPHRIVNANVSSLGSGEYIQFFDDYCVAQFVYVGSNWVVTNLYNSNIA